MPGATAADERDEKVEEELPELEVVELDEKGEPVDPKQAALLEDAGADDESGGEEDDERTALDDDPSADKRDARSRRKEIQRQARERDERTIQLLQRQNEELNGRLAAIEQRTQAVDLATLDQRIEAAKVNFNRASSVMRAAMARPAAQGGVDTDRYMQALDVRDQWRDEFYRLSNIKQNEVQRRESMRREAETTQVDPDVQRRVQAFQAKHTWWDTNPHTTDPDSAVLRSLDNQVARMGLDPATDAYWSKLNELGREKLPHRFGGKRMNGKAPDTGGERRQRTPPQAGNGSEGSGVKKGYVRITPARRAAMQESGAWDDPAKRKRQLAAYARYDAEHPDQKPA